MNKKKHDWLKIRNDYINSKISYRDLAEKHEVPFGTLRVKAKAENWVELRKNQEHETSIKLAQKTQEKIVNAKVNRMGTAHHLADKVAPKIDKAIDNLEDDDVKGLRQIVATIKDYIDIVKDDNNDDDVKRIDNVLSKIGGVI